MSSRDKVKNDEQFWNRLELEASSWFASSADTGLRRFWIDGFIPETSVNTKRGLDVEGTAWVGDGPSMQQQYRFVASVPQKLLHRSGWGFVIEDLSLNENQRTLTIVIGVRNQSGKPDVPENVVQEP